MQFKTIPKKPKDKIQIVRPNTGKTVGYIDFMIGQNQYAFNPAFDVFLPLDEISTITDKVSELNNTLSK